MTETIFHCMTILLKETTSEGMKESNTTIKFREKWY